MISNENSCRQVIKKSRQLVASPAPTCDLNSAACLDNKGSHHKRNQKLLSLFNKSTPLPLFATLLHKKHMPFSNWRGNNFTVLRDGLGGSCNLQNWVTCLSKDKNPHYNLLSPLLDEKGNCLSSTTQCMLPFWGNRCITKKLFKKMKQENWLNEALVHVL